MSDLISRCELFNRLATIPASPEANELKAQIYAVIQSMDAVEIPTISKMEQVDKDINVRSKDEPQIDCQWMR